MDIVTTKEALSSSFLFNIDYDKSFHNEGISFLCILQGDARVHFREFYGTMKSGDFLLMKDPGHCQMSSDKKALCLTVFFDYIFFTDQFAEDFEKLSCNSVLTPASYNEDIFSALVRLSMAHTADQETNRFLILHQIYQVFHLLKANCLVQPHAEASAGKNTDKQKMKLTQLKAWLKANHMSQITLQDAADYMSYTPQYLSNFIKKQTGETFNTYLNQLRLNSACNYLKYRDLPGDQIGFLCGFSNQASFQKAFQKKFLTTPEQYRTHYRSGFSDNFKSINPFTNPAVIRDYLSNSIHTDAGSSPAVIRNPQHRDIVCSVRDTSSLHATWQELINLGTARNFEMPTFREHLTMLQSQLHFRYGRVTNILSLISTYFQKGRKHSFNLSRVFEVIDFILSLGLKPLFDLGDKSPDIYLPDGKLTLGNPDTLDQIFGELVFELLKSCVNHYGYEEVSTWKFELWMRYSSIDLSEVERPEEYVKRFQTLYSIVKSIVPDAQTGAPGYNSFTPSEHFDRILNHLHAAQLYPDFISVYIYSFKTPQILTGSRRTQVELEDDPDFFRNRVAKLREICRKNHMGELPLYITEYSTYIAPDNTFNDSMYQAMFILKQSLDNWDKVDAMGYFLTTDYANEYPGNNAFLFGGNGIISRLGIKKPGFHAFGFLSMLGDRLIYQDSQCIITASGNDRYQILIYNYAHFLSNFCHHPSFYDIEKYPETALEDTKPLFLTLRLNGLRPGTYKIAHHLENADHGSIFHEWRKLDHSLNLNDFELNHLKQICVPAMTITSQTAAGSVQIDETVSRNEICFITLERTPD